MEDNIVKFDKDTPAIVAANKVQSVMAVNKDTGEVGNVAFDLLVNEAGKNIADAVKVTGNVLPTLGSVNKRYSFTTDSSGRTLTYGGASLVYAGNKQCSAFWDGTAKTWTKEDEVELPEKPLSKSLNEAVEGKALDATAGAIINKKTIVNINEVSSLESYSSGKTLVIDLGSTGHQLRLGVKLPSNFKSKKVNVKFTSTASISSTLYWQRDRAGSDQDWITPLKVNWIKIGETYIYEQEIESRYDLDEKSNIFLFVNNNVAVENKTTISITNVESLIDVNKVVKENSDNIKIIDTSLSQAKNDVSKLQADSSRIEDTLKKEDEVLNIIQFVNRSSYTIEQGSTSANRSDWNIPKSFLKEGDILRFRMLSSNRANPTKTRFYKGTTSLVVLSFAIDDLTQKYKSQEITYTIVENDLTGEGNLQFICQTYDSVNAMNAEVISVDYSNIFRRGGFVNLSEIENSVNENIGGITKALSIPFQTYKNMTPIIVKKVGGQFETVQEAINSIIDASITNQYDIQVWDDYEVTELTELYGVNSRLKNTNATTLTTQHAYIITKDWVHIRGMGGARKIRFESPKNIESNSVQYVQTIYPMGNCIIDNFYFSVKGGRYAVHQESGGSTTHMDYYATTIYRNMTAEHEGNDGYPQTWASQCAQANGTTSGANQIYENCHWVTKDYHTPYYLHANKNFSAANNITFINCSTFIRSQLTLSQFGGSYSDLGSGVVANIELIGCNMPKFLVTNAIYNNETERGMADLWKNGGGYLRGQGNVPMVLQFDYPSVLSFEAKTANHDIEVIGGSAKDLIFGNALKVFKGGTIAGKTYGEKRVWIGGAGNTSVYSLQYRLGNCADNPKTLIVKVNGVEYIITFDKNYMTADGSAYSWNTVPTITQASILADINNAHPTVFGCGIGHGLGTTTFQDCKIIGENRTSVTIAQSKLLVRDYVNGFKAWRLAQMNEKATGLSGIRLDSNTSGDIVLLNKVLLPAINVGVSNVIAGNYYKAGSDGSIVLASNETEALFVAVDSSTLMYIK